MPSRLLPVGRLHHHGAGVGHFLRSYPGHSSRMPKLNPVNLERTTLCGLEFTERLYAVSEESVYHADQLFGRVRLLEESITQFGSRFCRCFHV